MAGSLKPFLAWTWAGIRRIPRLIAFTLLFGAVGCGAVLSSGEKPSNWWTIAGWMEWFFNDQTRAVATLVTALATAAGLVLSIFQVFFSQAGQQAKEEILDRVDRSEGTLLKAINSSASSAQQGAFEGAVHGAKSLEKTIELAVFSSMEAYSQTRLNESQESILQYFQEKLISLETMADENRREQTRIRKILQELG